MKILFDQGTPAPLRRELGEHEVSTVFEMGWSDLVNGELLTRAEGAFDLLITTDQNLPYQQNLTDRKLAIIALSTTSWPRLKVNAHLVVAAVGSIKAGQYVACEIPES